MSPHYKAFLIVMVVSALAFWLARPAFSKFMSDETFVRRRNLWLSLTSCAFLIPSFWLYMGVAAVLIWRAGRRDPNPAALYLFLLLVVPPFQQAIPGFGLVTYLFQLDHFRLLTLVLILPAALRIRRAVKRAVNPSVRGAWLAPDVFFLMYGLLPIILSARYVTLTDSMRSAFLLGVDLLLPYYVLSRSCTSKQMIIDAIAAFALSAVILAPLAAFESTKGWLMYSNIADNWQLSSNFIGYLARGDTLRAQVTSGQSIILGNFYAVALGLWLYLQSLIVGWRRWFGTAAVLVGLVAALSRGPWVGAVVCGFAFFAVGPNAPIRVLKLVGVSAVVMAVVLASPMGATIVDHLPFIGTVDAGNVTYRQVLIDRMWLLIQQNPLFGSPYFLSYMEDLRTGEGIIDLLNVYLAIGMAYGLVTLAALVLFFATVGFMCLKVTRMSALRDPDTSRLGAALVASLSGAMVILYTVSNYLSVPYIYIGLTALMVAYSRIPTVVPEAEVQAGLPIARVDRRWSTSIRP